MTQSLLEPFGDDLWYLRTYGAFVALIGVISIAINIAIYEQLTGFKPGAWWASMLVLASAIFGILTINRLILLTTSVSSIVAVIVGLVGVVVDGLAASYINSLDACYYPKSSKYYGDSQRFSEASSCYTGSGSSNSRKCYCIDNDSECHTFKDIQDCGVILDSYPHLFNAAALFDGIGFLSVIILAVVSLYAYLNPDRVHRLKSLDHVVSMTEEQEIGGGTGATDKANIYKELPTDKHREASHDLSGGQTDIYRGVEESDGEDGEGGRDMTERQSLSDADEDPRDSGSGGRLSVETSSRDGSSV